MLLINCVPHFINIDIIWTPMSCDVRAVSPVVVRRWTVLVNQPAICNSLTSSLILPVNVRRLWRIELNEGLSYLDFLSNFTAVCGLFHRHVSRPLTPVTVCKKAPWDAVWRLLQRHATLCRCSWVNRPNHFWHDHKCSVYVTAALLKGGNFMYLCLLRGGKVLHIY